MSAPGAASTNTILVVDDDEDIRTVVSLILADAGYDVVTAENGRAALDRLRVVTPRLILLDMRMPIMDGWQLAQAYKSWADPRAPIVVLTAAQDAAGRAAQIDADGYLGKPFGVEELIEVVRAHAPADPS